MRLPKYVDPGDADPEAVAMWNSVKAELVKDMPEKAWEMWIVPTEGYRYEREGGYAEVVVLTVSEHSVTWLEQNALELMGEAPSG